MRFPSVVVTTAIHVAVSALYLMSFSEIALSLALSILNVAIATAPS